MNRIKITNEVWFPVQAFFNAIPDNDFYEALESFSNGVGRGYNDNICSFPGDLDQHEKPINGIKFTLFNEEITISYNEFLSILKTVIDEHLTRNYEQKEYLLNLYYKTCNTIKDKSKNEMKWENIVWDDETE